MAPNPAEDGEVIDLTDSPPQSPIPITSPQPTLSLPTRASVNNPNQPVSLPIFDGPHDSSKQPIREELDLTEDEDQDEVLRKAIALSLLSHQEEQARDIAGTTEEDDILVDVAKANAEDTKAQSQSQTPKNVITNSNGAFGMLGLDRKAMEAERLARLKRKRDADNIDSAEHVNSTSSPTNGGLAVSSKGHAASREENSHKKLKPSAPPTVATHSAETREVSPPPRSKPRPSPSNNVEAAPKMPVVAGTAAHPANRIIRDPASALPAPQNSSSHLPKPRLYPTPTLLRTYSPLKTSFTTSTSPCLLPTTTLTTLLTCPSTNSTNNLTSALLSSFTIDFDFLLPLFTTHSTNFVFILHAASAAHRRELESSFASIGNVRLVFPQAVGGMAGLGTMHSKISVLFYGPAKPAEGGQSDVRWKHGRCRILVPTGNLVAYDWGENGSQQNEAGETDTARMAMNVENLVWVVDLPVLDPAGGKQHQPQQQDRDETHFQKGLLAYLAAQAVPPAVLAKLRTVAFEPTRGMVGWVGSVAGFHRPPAASSNTRFPSKDSRTNTDDAFTGTGTGMGMGLYNLASTIRSLGLAIDDHDDEEDIQIDFLTSSLGSLTDEWVATFYEAACGRLGSSGDGHNGSQHKAHGRGLPTSTAQKTATKNQNLRIHYPSQQTVLDSLPGPRGAGTICFSDKWWDRVGFPQGNIRDAVSVGLGGKGLMHAKIVGVRFARARAAVEDEAKGKGKGKDKVVLGWYYVGSANCSESAWGRVTNTGTRLTIRNWEAGVVIPVYAPSPSDDDVGATEVEAHAKGKGKGKAVRSIQHGDQVTLQDFLRAMPLPMRVPGERMVDSGRRPWGGGGFGGFAGAGTGAGGSGRNDGGRSGGGGGAGGGGV